MSAEPCSTPMTGTECVAAPEKADAVANAYSPARQLIANRTHRGEPSGDFRIKRVVSPWEENQLRKMVLPLHVVAMFLALAAPTACITVKIDPIPSDKIGMVLMHGKGGTTNYVEFLRSKLESAGILVEMPLMPWSKNRIYDKGYEESMEEIDTYVARLKAAGAKRIFAAGHSLGANAALGYAARREGLSGAILLAYGHVPGLSGMAFRLSGSVAKARAMIDAGKGNETAVFRDYGGGNNTAAATANDLLSWFDPNGPATIANNAPKVKPNTPVLCVDGSSDKRKRCGKMMRLLPENSMNRNVIVNAGHLGTPSASVEQIANWLRALEEPILKHEGPRPGWLSIRLFFGLAR